VTTPLESLLGRSLVKELDATPDELRALIELGRQLKEEKRSGAERRRLVGRNIALIFEKTSTRTRCAFEVAAYDQGAHVTLIEPGSSQLGRKESVKDTARVLGQMYDGIEYRGFAQETVEMLARFAGVPVWNGLTDSWHPTQMLCDMLTMSEHAGKPWEELSFAYCGDARNNTANSLLVTGAMLGMDVRMVAPRALWNEDHVIAAAASLAAASGARLRHTEDPEAGVDGVDFVYTDVWVSMGEADEVWDQRVALLRPYRVDAALMAATRNPAARFMHCLPAYHDRQTEIGEEIYRRTGLDSLEVSDEVFESEASIVFDQAENRMHTIKALLVATLCRAI